MLWAASTVPRCPTDPPAHSEIWRPQRDFHLCLLDQRDNLGDMESVRKQDLRRIPNNVSFSKGLQDASRRGREVERCTKGKVEQ